MQSLSGKLVYYHIDLFKDSKEQKNLGEHSFFKGQSCVKNKKRILKMVVIQVFPFSHLMFVGTI